jgi:predicted phage terminase large subunit-like protein
MLRILDRDGEYRWHDVFPSLKVIDTNAKSMMIDIGKSRAEGKRFATLEFSSIGSQNAGKVRAQNLLYCDDLVDGIETAMSKDRLDKLWQMYYTDLRQRKIGDRCKELHIATRWSLYDVIGRLEREYADDPAARFIKYPVEDENGESLYNYPYGLGYTTKMLQDQKNIMDDASYRALFLQEPIEREGRLYDPEELRRYSSLPDREPDAVFAICDTKEQGDDYAVMPIVNQYGQDYYVVAFVCYNGKVEVIEDLVVDALMKYKVKICQVESNRGGMIFAQNIANRIKALGGGTNITTKWTQTNKETRIIVNAVWVKKHCLFKYENDYKTDREYKTAMNLLYSYSMAGRNKHDDAPDVMALLAEFCTTVVGVKAQVFNRIW